MTVDNTKHAADNYAYRNYQYQWTPPDVSLFKDRTFNGYRRDDGKWGTANYWLFMPTVFCENRNLDVIREAYTTSWATPLHRSINNIQSNW